MGGVTSLARKAAAHGAASCEASAQGEDTVVDAAAFRSAMRRFAGAVCIVATGTPGRRFGLTATAVCSISADPPRLLVCLNRNTGTHEAIVTNGRLSVNVLPREAIHLARRFAGMVPGVSGEERFAEGDWSTLAGVPVLDGACVALACRVAETIPASTHSMFLCDIVAVHSAAGDPGCSSGEALIYLDGCFRQLAPLACNEAQPIEWLW